MRPNKTHLAAGAALTVVASISVAIAVAIHSDTDNTPTQLVVDGTASAQYPGGFLPAEHPEISVQP